MKRRPVAIALSIALTAVAAACGSGDDDTNQDTDAGTIRITHRTGVASWDIAKSRSGPETPILGLVYDRLINLEPNGDPAPGLAESWEFGEGGQLLTLKLRDSVTFTDGAAFDSSVVKANLERQKTVEGSTVSASLANITAIEAPDPSTVTIRQTNPDAALVMLLADRFGMMMSPQSISGSGEITEPVGTGPFILRSQTPQASYVLERNDDYWNRDLFKVGQVEITVLEDATARLNALRSGQADAGLVDANQIEEVKGLPGKTVVPYKGIAVRAIWVNQDMVPAFKDLRVRQALNYAIDRKSIVSGLAFGYGEPAFQLIPPISSAHDPSIGEPFPFDPERAKALLAEAGHADGLSFQFGVQPPFAREAEAIQQQWAAVGVQVEITQIASFALGEALWAKKTVPAGLATWAGRLDPGFSYALNNLPGAPQNPGNFADPQAIELIEDARAELDPAARVGKLQAIAKHLATNPQGTWPIFFPQEGLVHDEKVTGLENWSDGFPHLENVSVSG
jgi:peptide/nickel transport system substrate-binding protein